MDKNIVIIGACGVGKSMLSRALMTLQLRNAVITVVDVSDVKPEHGEITGAWLDEFEQINRAIESRQIEVGKIKVNQGLPPEIALMLRKSEFDCCSISASRNQYKDLRHGFEAQKVTGAKRRNKSERKRGNNRANRWR